MAESLSDKNYDRLTTRIYELENEVFLGGTGLVTQLRKDFDALLKYFDLEIKDRPDRVAVQILRD